MGKIRVETLKGKQYVVMKTDINGEEYDPDLPTTPERWDELREHMRSKRWWTPQHERELSAIAERHKHGLDADAEMIETKSFDTDVYPEPSDGPGGDLLKSIGAGILAHLEDPNFKNTLRGFAEKVLAEIEQKMDDLSEPGKEPIIRRVDGRLVFDYLTGTTTRYEGD